MTIDHSNETLIQLHESGADLEFVFFWGPDEVNEPRGCFNQWHPAKFQYKGFMFSNAEQAMMATKASVFGDWGTLFEILNTTNPRAVKALGRQVRGYDDVIWNGVRSRVVQDINVAKFGQNPDMLDHLLATGDKILVKASPFDQIWGIGMDEDHPDVRDPSKWKGQNLLGQVLMTVREMFRFDVDD